MADTIIVDLPGGGTAEFPASFSPERITFELKRMERSQPPDSGVRKVTDWAATRGLNAAEEAARLPSVFTGIGDFVRGLVKEPGRKLRTTLGLPQDAGPHAAPAMGGRPSPSGPPVAPPAQGNFNQAAFDALGIRELGLPGPVGQAVDKGVEAAISAPAFGGGFGALVPAFAGGVTSDAAGQMTAGTPWEIPARLAGGLVGGGLGAVGQASVPYAAKATKTLVEPFYQGGRESIVGRALNKAASEPATAVPRMQASAPTIPGSMPTAAQAANDPGLLALENALKGRTGDQFALRTAASNEARTAAADAVAPTVTAQQAGDTARGAMQSRKDALELLRKRSAGPMYEAAKVMDPAIKGQPILDALNKSIMTETGPIRDALRTARGSLYIGEGEGRRLASSPAEWQAVRRSLDAQIGNAANNPALERALVGVRSQVDDALKSGDMFRLADQTFRQMSEPLRSFDKKYGPRVAKALETGPYQGPYTRASELLSDDFMKRGMTGLDELFAATGPRNAGVKQALVGRYMDDFKSAIRTTADDPLGNKVLSAAAADKWWQANKDAFSKTATPAQVKAMQTLVDDFAVGARRPQGVAGSNTAQNLASGNILNAVLRFPALADSSAAQSLMRPLQWLYKMPEEALQETLMKAMLDPKVAAALMAKPSAANVKMLAPMLERAMMGAEAAAPGAVAPATKRDGR